MAFDRAATGIRSGKLKRLLANYSTVELGVYAVYSSRRQLPLKLRYLIDFLVDSFKKPEWTSIDTWRASPTSNARTSAEDEHWQRTMRQYFLGFTADKQAVESLATVGRHEDHIATGLFGCPDNLFIRVE